PRRHAHLAADRSQRQVPVDRERRGGGVALLEDGEDEGVAALLDGKENAVAHCRREEAARGAAGRDLGERRPHTEKIAVVDDLAELLEYGLHVDLASCTLHGSPPRNFNPWAAAPARPQCPSR